jgi:hypothetical protein
MVCTALRADERRQTHNEQRNKRSYRNDGQGIADEKVQTAGHVVLG